MHHNGHAASCKLWNQTPFAWSGSRVWEQPHAKTSQKAPRPPTPAAPVSRLAPSPRIDSVTDVGLVSFAFFPRYCDSPLSRLGMLCSSLSVRA